MGDYKIEALKDHKLKYSELWACRSKVWVFTFKKIYLFALCQLRRSRSWVGSGILLSILSEEYPQHNFVGLEPFGDGFSNLKELNTTVRLLDVNLLIESYEQHQFKYDFIYCINVFEHVDNWQHFLKWASISLKKWKAFSAMPQLRISL